jgi:hypothetical protein
MIYRYDFPMLTVSYQQRLLFYIESLRKIGTTHSSLSKLHDIRGIVDCSQT